MLPAQKDKLLLQRRTRDLESARRTLQVPLVIREPCVTSTKGEYNDHLIYVSFQWPEGICFSNS
ncbi:hypothetical protein KY285_017966 [Solanum tuberosum]|nr:hypothetical protein KY284_017956 [Solanum tuberosum]KAH0690764.1 hypothetical protein KY289_018122 [Solanum tuberosum]KAH0703688.1 hypothetical protein KY285_017966 [Solanum tuberosum]